MPVAILAQIAPPFAYGGLAFGPGEWNSGDAPVYADITLFVYGALMLCAAAIMQKWSRTGIIAIGVLEVMLIVQVTTTGSGGHSSPTSFILVTAIVLAACLVMAFPWGQGRAK